ncbi:MAG: site-2 protease family protein [Phycisphaerales bacterium]|nr:site-2 protease family protein [Planctomycetota bacterium]MBL6996890.1 site-2 protease family protein [Phycisphaerales bacterium]
MTWWVHDLWNADRGVELISWIFWVLLSITLHELAHGWAALWEGDDTPRITGHMTMNPVVHMGVTSIIAFLIIGIAWGMMPVNPYRLRHVKWGRILVSFAGPAMNLLIAFVVLTVLGFVIDPLAEQTHVETFLLTGGFLNLILFTLNMLPVPPLDGSNILGNLFQTVGNWYRHPQAQMAGLLLFFLLIMTNMFSVVFVWAQYCSAKYALFIYSLVN